jgi:hypothetical protein
MSLPAQLQMDRPSRITLDRAATLRDPAQEPLDVTVDNISSTGCLVATDAKLTDGMLVTIGIAGLGTRGAYVARQEASGYGLAFLKPASDIELLAARNAETLVDGGFAPFPAGLPTDATSLIADGAIAPVPDERFSRRTRFTFMVGTSVALWGAIGFGTTRLLFG